MTVEPQTYRIERFGAERPETEPVKFSSGETFLVDFEDGYAVVKDTRLQAIADAPRCEHGNVYRHIIEDSITAALMINNPGDAIERCEGAPELAVLLDALTEENKT